MKKLLKYMQWLHQYDEPNSVAKDMYIGEMERGGNVPESMRTKNWFMEYSDRDHLNDYSKMRQEQAYWPKALREMQSKEE